MNINDLIEYLPGNKNQPYARCKVCGKTFMTLKGIKLHVWRHVVEYKRISEIIKNRKN